jgi:hypothetical protein
MHPIRIETHSVMAGQNGTATADAETPSTVATETDTTVKTGDSVDDTAFVGGHVEPSTVNTAAATTAVVSDKIQGAESNAAVTDEGASGCRCVIS